jgi:hypothetical protein
MRGSPNKTESAMKTPLNFITPDANTASTSKSSQKKIVSVQYNPVGETSVGTGIPLELPGKDSDIIADFSEATEDAIFNGPVILVCLNVIGIPYGELGAISTIVGW